MTPTEIAKLCAHHDAILKQFKIASTADELCELSIKATAIQNEITKVFEDMETKRTALVDEANELLIKIANKPHVQSPRLLLSHNLLRLYEDSQA